MAEKISPQIPWARVDTVLLDMDGTLLDRHFDDYFWERYVPKLYADKKGLSFAEAREELLQRYRREEGKLAWTDLDFWSKELGLDIPELKTQVDHLIEVHPYVIDFLTFLQKNRKRAFLVTNAHHKTIALKLRKTRLGGYFEDIVCSFEIGAAKESLAFWRGLEARIHFAKERCLLAEDTERILYTAKEFGIAHLIYVARPSSTKPASYSEEFRSIEFFNELLPE